MNWKAHIVTILVIGMFAGFIYTMFAAPDFILKVVLPIILFILTYGFVYAFVDNSLAIREIRKKRD